MQWPREMYPLYQKEQERLAADARHAAREVDERDERLKNWFLAAVFLPGPIIAAVLIVVDLLIFDLSWI